MVQLPKVESRFSRGDCPSNGGSNWQVGSAHTPARERPMTSQPDAVEAPVHTLIAPNRLTSDHRLEFRRAALEILERAVRAEASRIDVDLGATAEMDASGLGVLVLLQKRARERGLRIRLLNPSRAIREMLQLTRLDAFFEFAAPE